jgi:hypothetical protein
MTVELRDIQFSKTVSGTVVDQSGAPVADVEVAEVSSDWKTSLRTTQTGADGKWSLTPVHGRKWYFIRLTAPGFNELRFRMQLSNTKSQGLRIVLSVAT